MAASGAALWLSAATPALAATQPDARCTRIVRTALDRARIVSADLVRAGKLALPDDPAAGGSLADRTAGLPEFCRVKISASPSRDSVVGIELWLPTRGWNGRFLGTGTGGAGGAIGYSMGMIEGLKRGFAVANTDLGTAPDVNALAKHSERWADFGHRATHEMARLSKQLVRGFYAINAVRSYFEGCSTGGQQALVTAQFHPGDYDGILAGAPGSNRTHSTTYFIWNYLSLNSVPGSQLSSAQWVMVNRAVLSACAGKDGGAPGDMFLTDPRRCGFDPGSIAACASAAPADTCLTPVQLAAVRRLYAGPVNPRTGERIYAGLPMGSEILPLGPERMSDPRILDRLFVLRWGMGENFPARTFDFDRDQDQLDARLSSTLNANRSDLADFSRRGGKLMIYTGLADPGVPYADVIAYYDRVMASSEAGKGRDFARLFLVPGMGHCFGGPGVTDIGQPMVPGVPAKPEGDALMALVAWVERGVAPSQIIASKPAEHGLPAQERPVCAYPALPDYRSGNPALRSSFVCRDHAVGSSQEPALRYLN